MTSKIKNIDVTYIKFGCFGIEKAVGVIHIKSGNSDIKKQPHTRKMRTSHTAFLKENPPKIETENWCQLRKFYILL